MANIPDVNFNKIPNKGVKFNQNEYYEGNFDKINQQIVPKVNELDDKVNIDIPAQLAENTQLLNDAIDGDIQAVLNSEVVATDINNKLTALETTYAPRLDMVEVGAVSRKVETVRKKYVVMLDDDGYKEVLTRLKPIADEKGFKFSMALLPKYMNDNDPRTMTWAEVQQLLSEGHDGLSHSVSHLSFQTLTPTQIEYELKESKRLLAEKGIIADHFVYPGGGRSYEIDNQVRKYYQSAVATGSGEINQIPLDQYNVRRSYFDEYDLNYHKAGVDRLVAADHGVLVFMMHAHFPVWADGSKGQELRDLVDYIRANNLEIVTYGEAIKYLVNRVDVGSKGEGKYFKVGPDGTMHGHTLDEINLERASVKHPKNSLSFDTLPNFFKKRHITITDFNNAQTGTAFPEGKSGMLVTYMADDAGYQYWYPYSSDNVYIRRKVAEQNAWTVFALQPNKPILYLRTNLQFGTINPNSTKKMVVAMPGVAYGSDMAVVNCRGGSVAGVMLNATVLPTTNEVEIQAANITTNAIVFPPTQDVMIRVFK